MSNLRIIILFVFVTALSIGTSSVHAQEGGATCAEGEVECVVERLEFNNQPLEGSDSDLTLLLISAGGIMVTGIILAIVRTKDSKKKLNEDQREAELLSEVQKMQSKKNTKK